MFTIKNAIGDFCMDHPVTTVVLAASVIGVPLLIWAIVHHKNK